MPVAVVVDEGVRKPLKTCPPDGYVIIKRMDQGEKLQRGDLSSKMRFNAGKKSRDVQGEIDVMQTKTTIWDWQHLIIEHNLQDVDGRPLNFKNEVDIRRVAAKIAEEINTYMDEVNNFEADAEDEDTDLGN